MTIDTLSRAAVVVSLLAAVAVGTAPYFAQPSIAFALVAVLLASAAAARIRLAYAAPAVLLLAYVTYGLVRMAGGPALAATPFWLAAFVGLVVGGTPWTAWRAPSPWRVPIAWWALGVALSWPVVAARETSFRFDNPAVTGTIVGAAVVQMSCALWLDFMLASRERRDVGPAGSERSVLYPLAISAVVTALAAIYQRVVDITWLSGEPWSGLGRATGMMGDANPMGVVTALMAPLVLAALLPNARVVGEKRGQASFREWLFRAAVLGMAVVLWTAAWVSGARSTLILLAGAAIGLTLGWAMSRGIGLRRVIYAGAAVGALVVALLFLALPRLPASSPVARLVATLPVASPGAVLYELLWRRDGYGLAAVEAVADRPLNGVGIGRFSAVAPAYYARVERRAIPPDNAQNLWRQVLAERGFLGFLPVAWLTLLTIAAIGRRTVDPQRAVLHTMIAALGVVLMFGYPLQDPAVAATAATIVGIAGRSGGFVDSSPAPRAVWVLAVVAAVLGAVVDFFG